MTWIKPRLGAGDMDFERDHYLLASTLPEDNDDFPHSQIECIFDFLFSQTRFLFVFFSNCLTIKVVFFRPDLFS